jgi:hypothetical protein
MLVEVYGPAGDTRIYELDAGDVCPVCREGELVPEPVGDGSDDVYLICDYCQLEFWPTA